MPTRILIVEDEILVAMELQNVLEDLGYEVVGAAPDARTARHLADDGVDLALVDLNLRDGLTGPGLGEELAREHGVTVLYMTANPGLLPDDVDGPVGVLTKPYDQDAVQYSIDFAIARRRGDRNVSPPAQLRLFTGYATL